MILAVVLIYGVFLAAMNLVVDLHLRRDRSANSLLATAEGTRSSD